MKRPIGTIQRYNERHSRTETHTVLKCDNCGHEITPKGKPESKKVQLALNAACKNCSPIPKPQHAGNWWSELGLKKNPYVYGPMPWKRTGDFWRRVEARERGWLAWYWTDNHYKVIQGS